MPMSFVMSKNVEHSSEKTLRELEIYKSYTSVISTHFVDQVQIFFFFTHCIVVKEDSKPIVHSRTCRQLDWIRKRRSGR